MCVRSWRVFDYDKLKDDVGAIEAEQQDPAFWNDQERAQGRIRELQRLKGIVDPLGAFATEIEELDLLQQMAKEEGDESTLSDVAGSIDAMPGRIDAYEIDLQMSGEHDTANAFLSIQAGAGGTESCDWAQMMLRMYTKYAESKGWKVHEVDIQHADEAGIKSADVKIEGDMAFGHLRAEIGVHRLVRISPFDYQGRRHTSFCSVDVSPEIEEGAIELNKTDLRIDTYRAGGAGGQHVNTTDSAVRITHEPTGIVVQCQNERSQHKNRAQAMRVMLSRLYEHRRREQEAAQLAKYGQKGEIGFGSQIRSYVLQPYTMAKDHRTNHEKGDVHAVLDGRLDDFIRAYHRWRMEIEAESGGNDD